MENTFKTPEQSARPVSFLSVVSSSFLPSSSYLLYWGEKEVAEEAWGGEERRKLGEVTERLIENWGPFNNCSDNE